MRRQISNTNMQAYKLFLVLVFICLFAGHVVLFNIPDSRLMIPSVFLLFYYLFFGRFYNIEIDYTWLYYSGYLKKGKILFKNIISVKEEWFRYNLFFKAAYGITVKYLDEQDKIKKIKFLSPATAWGRHPFEIMELKELKRRMDEAKKASGIASPIEVTDGRSQ
ncbi:MAG TPA: hypothetical protein VK484_00770 [Ferruginibacter sp.]|nr:hypothetical protein [Ferruginibacter sp.]